MPDRAILPKARQYGLVRSESGGYWRANGPEVTRILKASLRQLPTDPVQLGDLLHGLGELDAHSQASFLNPLIEYLKPRRSRARLGKVLETAVAHESKSPQPLQAPALAFIQWLSHATLQWNTFDIAIARFTRSHEPAGSGRFGLRFVAKVIFAVDHGVIDAWIASHSDHPNLAPIGSAALSTLFPGDNAARAEPLLRSRHAAIKCLAAASLVQPVFHEVPSLDLRACFSALTEGVGAGVDP